LILRGASHPPLEERVRYAERRMAVPQPEQNQVSTGGSP